MPNDEIEESAVLMQNRRSGRTSVSCSSTGGNWVCKKRSGGSFALLVANPEKRGHFLN